MRVVDDNPRQSQIVVMKTERGYLPVDVPYPQRWLRVTARGGGLDPFDFTWPGFILPPLPPDAFRRQLIQVAASGEDFGCSMGNVIAVEIQNLIQAKRLAIDLQETNLIAWL
ncbi:Uncharacterised protein [Klebsiella pneumoniae]|nr:Uncharacterised protein [Klebsiella pneumoniae]